MAMLLGARPVIVGLRAGIAASLVELGISSDEIVSCLSLERAFELIERDGPTTAAPART
jgi:hypothetical protein